MVDNAYDGFVLHYSDSEIRAKHRYAFDTPSFCRGINLSKSLHSVNGEDEEETAQLAIGDGCRRGDNNEQFPDFNIDMGSNLGRFNLNPPHVIRSQPSLNTSGPW